jgi:hypothetical protein
LAQWKIFHWISPSIQSQEFGANISELLKPQLMTSTSYVARTNNAFILTETVKVAQLIHQGATFDEIRQQVIEEDLFQLRSLTSRSRVLNTVLQRLQKVDLSYIKLLTLGNTDIRRLTNLFLILRSDLLLRELIDEVLLDKLKRLVYTVNPAELRTFFETKREQSPTIAKWSDSTYQKTASNTVLVLVSAGLLQPIKPRGNYEIRPVPIPGALRQQLLLDGEELYLRLMLN